VAGKFYLCLQNAAAKLATSRPPDCDRFIDDAIKCNAEYFDRWAKEDAKAANARTTCLDGDGQASTFADIIGNNVALFAGNNLRRYCACIQPSCP